MKHLVVGSGIVGLLIARGLQTLNKKVILIESQEKIGGLLGKSYEYEGLIFDYGTHLIPSTGNQGLDDIILGENQTFTQDWVPLPVIKSGNYTNGKLNIKSPYIDIHGLDKKKYQKACVEILNAQPPSGGSTTLNKQLKEYFGATVTKEIYAPALKKLFGISSKFLSKDSFRIFLPPRIIIGSPMINKELKKSPYFDTRLANSSVKKSEVVSCMHYYPHKKGVFNWVSKMKTQFLKEGGTLFTSTTVSKIEPHSNGMYCFLSNNKKIKIKNLWWTATPIHLFQLLGKKVALTKEVSFRQTHLVHFIFDKKFLVNLYFLTCFDPKFKTFRVTLYPEIKSTSKDRFHCTVEVLNQSKKVDSKKIIVDIEGELKAMGVVNSNAKNLHACVQSLGNTFPVKDAGFSEMVQKIEQLEQTLPAGIYIEGVAKGKSFFMRDVLLDAYKSLRSVK